jgi:phage tail-like protein
VADSLLEDPHGGYFFKLEIDNAEVAHIMEVGGIKTSAQVFEIEEGGANGFKHKRVGQSTWENLTIRYATSSSRFLQRWRDDFLKNPLDDALWKSGSIVMINNDGQAVRRFHFVRAWPVAWEGPSLDSGSSGLAMESLELAHEGIRVSDR